MASPEDVWSDGYLMIPRRWFPKAGHRGRDALDFDRQAREPEARVDLLAMANHDDRNGLARGCCDPSLQFLADRWNWTRSKVVRFFDRLEREAVITRQKRTGQKRSMTRFLAYDPPQRAGTSAVQSEGQSRYKESQSPQGLPGIARHSPAMPSGTPAGPNRTKRVALARKEEGYERKACPSCWSVEIGVDDEACSRCLGLSGLQAEIDAWQPDGVAP